MPLGMTVIRRVGTAKMSATWSRMKAEQAITRCARLVIQRSTPWM